MGCSSPAPFMIPGLLFGCAVPLVGLRFPASNGTQAPAVEAWARSTGPPGKSHDPWNSTMTSVGWYFSLGKGPFLSSQDVVPGVFWILKLKYGPGLFSIC